VNLFRLHAVAGGGSVMGFRQVARADLVVVDDPTYGIYHKVFTSKEQNLFPTEPYPQPTTACEYKYNATNQREELPSSNPWLQFSDY
jgi:hypothetical protein